MTYKERATLYVDFVSAHGRAPRGRELAELWPDLAPASIKPTLATLRRLGLIKGPGRRSGRISTGEALPEQIHPRVSRKVRDWASLLPPGEINLILEMEIERRRQRAHALGE